MQFRFFAHSWLSDWNHGNAHFLRGLVAALMRRGHQVRAYEEIPQPAGGWSLAHLLTELRGPAAIAQMRAAFAQLDLRFYGSACGSLHPVLAAACVRRVQSWEDELRDADWIIAHEWNPPELFHWLLEQRQKYGFRVLLHDTHHRSLTEPGIVERLPLSHFDGVLAFGRSLAQRYQRAGAKHCFVLHEAADATNFHPRSGTPMWDLIWIGNWGDDERTSEIDEYLFRPVQRLRLRALVFGVRYPPDAIARLRNAGIEFGGYLPNLSAPEAYASSKVALHIPRGPYARELPGIPTIRVFEALACGSALVCAPWTDSESLFDPDNDFATVPTGEALCAALVQLLSQEEQRKQRGAHGAATIAARHTCTHRAQQLEAICQQITARHAPASTSLSSAPV